LTEWAGILKSRVGGEAAACCCGGDDADCSSFSFFPNRPAASVVMSRLLWASELLLHGGKFLPDDWNDLQSFAMSKHHSSEPITRRVGNGIGLEDIMLEETTMSILFKHIAGEWSVS